MRAVLTYHSIDDSGSPISVSPEAFERHVRWLASGRVQVTTIDDLAACSVDAQAVALTFDDGFENFATRAAPLLTAQGFPVTLFVVTDRVGGTNQWNGRPAPGIPTLPLLDWGALEKLVTAGVTLGAHTSNSSRSHASRPSGDRRGDRRVRGMSPAANRRRTADVRLPLRPCEPGRQRPSVVDIFMGLHRPSSAIGHRRAARRSFLVWTCTTIRLRDTSRHGIAGRSGAI